MESLALRNAEGISVEQALRESEERWKFALEVAGAGVLDWNTVSGTMFFSERWRAMTGYAPEEIAGTVDWLEAQVHPDDLPAALADLQRVLDGKAASHKVEHRLKCADGRWIWVESRSLVTRRALDGTPLRMIGTHVDITARKKAEEEDLRFEAQLRESEKLQSLGVLAGGIAHDFNNLLAGILGYADLALLQLPQSSPAREPIGKAINGAQRAAELTRQMLAYAGRGCAVVSSVNLASLVEDLIPLLQMSISKKVAIHLHLPSDLPPIEADAAQMRQIVMNLIINASEAIGDRGGFITIVAGVRQCDRQYLAQTVLGQGLSAGSYVYLDVADNGCGMSEETRARIFDPFFTTKSTGRGLGLSAVLGIVRGHGGSILCSGALGEGTICTVLLPEAATPAMNSEQAKAAAIHWEPHGTVLVVDDEEMIREMGRLMFERMGFTALTAVDGLDAVRIFRQESETIRLVLLDLNMPRLNGEETLRQVRSIRSDVRVILTSGYNEQCAADYCDGRAVFIQKPFRFSELSAAIGMLLGKPEHAVQQDLSGSNLAGPVMKQLQAPGLAASEDQK
jgi:two-component system cell cycle sensor histidine kinase/response regulator CckA